MRARILELRRRGMEKKAGICVSQSCPRNCPERNQLGGKRALLSTGEVPEPRRCRAGAAQTRMLVAELLGIHSSSILASSHVRMESSSRAREPFPCAKKAGAFLLHISYLGSSHIPDAHRAVAGLYPALQAPVPLHTPTDLSRITQGHKGSRCWNRKGEAGREERTFQ